MAASLQSDEAALERLMAEQKEANEQLITLSEYLVAVRAKYGVGCR
jgi:hypothetical protein